MGEILMSLRRSECERDTARPCIIGPVLVLSCRPGSVSSRRLQIGTSRVSRLSRAETALRSASH